MLPVLKFSKYSHLTHFVVDILSVWGWWHDSWYWPPLWSFLSFGEASFRRETLHPYLQGLKENRSLETCLICPLAAHRNGSTGLNTRNSMVRAPASTGGNRNTDRLIGPISSVTIFGQTLIIINDREIASQILEKNSAKHSSRPHLVFADEL